MTEETAIAEAQPVRALVTPEQAKADWNRFIQLRDALLISDDYQTIAGKQFPRKSAFRKLAVAFGLSDRILHEEKVEREDATICWRIEVEVSHPNGRTCTGVGACDSRERKGGNASWAHLEHDVYSTAHTRAKNRAIADMVAAGMVSAEEMEAVEPGGTEPQSSPAPSKPKPAPRRNSEERVFSFKGAGPESGPEPAQDPHPF